MLVYPQLPSKLAWQLELELAPAGTGTGTRFISIWRASGKSRGSCDLTMTSLLMNHVRNWHATTKQSRRAAEQAKGVHDAEERVLLTGARRDDSTHLRATVVGLVSCLKTLEWQERGERRSSR